MLDDIDIPTLSARPGFKWSTATAAGAIPAWVADMDFPVAEPVLAAMRESAAIDLGYPAWQENPRANPLIDAYVERTARLHGHRPDPGGIRVFTEIIQALQAILHVTTAPGDAVALHTPAYPPFLETIATMGRRLVPIPMVDDGDGWVSDPAPLAGCKVLILVNPHNPTGRVLTRAELTGIAELAERHDVLVIADEVHSELIYEPHRHIPFAAIAPERTVTLNSASKAFNLAGLRCAVADVAVPAVRKAQRPQQHPVEGLGGAGQHRAGRAGARRGGVLAGQPVQGERQVPQAAGHLGERAQPVQPGPPGHHGHRVQVVVQLDVLDQRRVAEPGGEFPDRRWAGT
ncbi:aminotransferase class I/II-fold pyridoxal phosphate-dependent enzyme [Actinoplanes philippinensis]|uniref:aminotransferase class I/II-fold pyridoxal phosphate-dependent enzyme n=1 Tax=Actinoplanes philippinensis TaxID=35752 RepID=UPI0033E6FEB8